MEYLVLWMATSHDLKKDIDVIARDGGVVTIDQPNEHIVSTYYQDRINPDFLLKNAEYTIWDVLGWGKAYTKDWVKEETVNQTILDDAMDWLCMSTIVGKQKFEYKMYCYQPNEDYNAIVHAWVTQGKIPTNENEINLEL